MRPLHRLANRVLGVIERPFVHHCPGRLAYPPIFIVGPPRSGSTSLYLYLTAALDVTVLNNLDDVFYGAPVLVHRLAGARFEPTVTSLDSNRGKVKGLAEPSECGNFWYRFFPREAGIVQADDVDAATLRRLRSEIGGLGLVRQRPVLFKNLYCSLRIDPIHRTLPEARFIVIHRELLANAVSILRARSADGDVQSWWSVRPPGEGLADLSPPEQAVVQVTRIHEVIEESRRFLDPSLFLDVDFEAFVSDPARTLDAVTAFIQQDGTAVRRRPRQIPTPTAPEPPDPSLADAVRPFLTHTELT